MLYSIFGAAMAHVPNRMKGIFLDIESGVDPIWFGHITGFPNMEKVFGKKSNDGKWEIPPLIRYYKPSTGEQGLKFIKRILKKLPNKVLIGENWYYCWVPVSPKIASATGGMTITDCKKALGENYSKSLFKKYANFYVPIPGNYGGPEMVIGVDSWAAMTPEQIADDDSNALGAQARMFSKHLNDLKALVSMKGVTLVGTNQIREKIGAWGNPEYSPGGNTKKHTTDVRLRIGSVKNQNGAGQVEIDDVDQYRHWKIKNTKNKTFIPFKECLGRWWIEHNGDTGYGLCPVQDCLTGDTLVTTNKGLIRLDEIPKYANILETKKNTTFLDGLKVLSSDGKYHNVNNFMKKGKKETFKVTTCLGHEVKATANHKFLVLSSNGQLDWRPTSKLDLENDYLIISKSGKFPDTKKFIEKTYIRKEANTAGGSNQYVDCLPKKVEVTEDLAYLAGYLISDGHLKKSSKEIGLTCGWYTSNVKSKNKLIRLIKKTFGREPSVTEYSATSGKNVKTKTKLRIESRKKSFAISLNSKEAWNIFNLLGVLPVNSKEKCVPSLIFNSPKPIITSFLRGLYAGDGSYAKGDSVFYSSYSEELLLGVSRLLWALGVYNNKTRCFGYAAREFKKLVGKCETKEYMPISNTDTKVLGKSKSWGEKLPMKNGHGYNLSVENLFSDKPLVSRSVKPLIDEYRKIVESLQKAGLLCSRIKSIEFEGTENVYDIEVEDTHNFIANGVVVHNCLNYLKMTGQISMGRKGIKINMQGKNPKYAVLAEKSFTNATFKKAILEKKVGKENIDIRKLCQLQMRNGKGIGLYLRSSVEVVKEDTGD